MHDAVNEALDKLLAEKAKEEAAELAKVKPLTPEQAASERGFLKRWTQNGKQMINNAGGNFWIPGSNRKRGTIMRPAQLKQLVDAGIIKQVGRSYQFIPEGK
jgi:hypothetical protein